MNYKILKVIFFFFFHNNQYYLFPHVETHVDIDGLQQHSSELQDVNTQTEDNEEYQRQQEVCFLIKN